MWKKGSVSRRPIGGCNGKEGKEREREKPFNLDDENCVVR